MADPVAKIVEPPLLIKRYGGGRLYRPDAARYLTLDDLAGMIKAGDEFEVRDAKSGEDITRRVLTDIIKVRN